MPQDRSRCLWRSVIFACAVALVACPASYAKDSTASVKDAEQYVAKGNLKAAEIELRNAIRETRKLAITYANEEGRRTQRTIWPIAMAYYVDVTLVGAWCELRQDFRHFRVDRILSARVLDERFPANSGKLMAEWLALQKDRSSAAAA